MAANNGYAKARPVIGPDDTTYKGVRAASRATNIELSKLHGWIKVNRNGWRYAEAEPPKLQGRKKKVFEPMSVEEATSILEILPEIRDWITNRIIHAEKSLLNRIAAGEQIDGYEAKENLGHRQWRDESEALTKMLAAGLREDQVVSKRLLGPTEVLSEYPLNSLLNSIDIDLADLCQRNTSTSLAKVEAT